MIGLLACRQSGDGGAGGRCRQAFADALPDGSWSPIPTPIVLANRSSPLSGYDLDELIGLAVETLVPARHRQAHQQHRAAFADMPRTRPIGSGLEIVLCRQDGSELPVDIALRPGRLGGTGQVGGGAGASERKQLEQALWHSEQRLRLLVGGVADYAIFMLDLQGRVVSWNEGAERIKVWRREEILGEHRSRFYPPEQAATGGPARTLAAATGTAGSRTRADGCARTGHGSGPTWW